MAAWGSGFVLPRRGSYFTLGTDSDPKYWTGYVTNAPQLEYAGKDSATDQPKWTWEFQGTDDSYILNLAPLGILPVYINQTQGSIIKDLAARIAPTVFDTTNVADGQLVPYYFVDPTRTFGQIIKEFAENAYYRFWANDYKLYYERQDTTPAKLIINGHTAYSSRVRITTSTNTTPIVVTTESAHGLSNGDCISITDHKTVSGAKSAAVGNWFVESVGATTVTLTGSVGNGVGTGTGWLGKHNPHFTPANLKIGPINDPVINDCIVIGDVEPQGIMNEYWVGDGLTNAFPMLSSIYGVDSAKLLDEIFSGGPDPDTNVWTVVDSVNDVLRVDNGYLNVIGNVADNWGVYLMSKALIPLQGHLRLTHGEFDFIGSTNNGVIASLWTTTPSSSLTGCVYGIRVTASGSNIILQPIVNGVVQSQTYTAKTQSANRRYVIRTLVTFENIFRNRREYLYRLITGTLGSYGGQNVSDKPTYRTIITEIDATTGKTTTNQGFFSNTGAETGLASTQFYAAYVPVVSNNLHLTLSNITLSVPMQVSLRIARKENWVSQYYNYDQDTGSLFNPDITSVGWTNQIIGPNEIDSYDGMNPIATIVTTRAGRIDQGNILGSTLYNSGDATLTFFKDSLRQTGNTPNPGQLLHLRYRRAGIAIGRAQNTTLITEEADLWGDSGYRTVTRKDLSPLPRTSVECEMAAAAIVEENSYQHYAGTYTQSSTVEFTGVPKPGTVLKFANLPSGFPAVQAELITAVSSTIDSRTQNIVLHEVTFGKPDKVKKFLASLEQPKNPFAPPDTAELPTASDLEDIIESTTALSLIFNPITLTLTYGGTSSILPDIALDTNISLQLKSWTSDPQPTATNTYTIDIGQAPPAGGGFEIRYADQGWGDANNKNFLYYGSITDGKTTAQTFQVPRTRNTAVFVRAYDSTGKYSRYSAGIRIVFPGIPLPPSSIEPKGGTPTHPIFKANLPIDSESGFHLVNSDIYGLEVGFANSLPMSGWFNRNGASQVIGTIDPVDNPGEYNGTTSYQVNEVTTPANTGGLLIPNGGYINFETSISITATSAHFFVWVKGTAGKSIRLNIKDNSEDYLFYSKTDITFTGAWQAVSTRAARYELLDENGVLKATGQYNVVIQNLSNSTNVFKMCLPFLVEVFHSVGDITMGASNDNPSLLFTYPVTTATTETEPAP